MGQKVNSSGFRALNEKSWSTFSYISLFNYNSVVNQDLLIKKFISGLLRYLQVFHSFIRVSRLKGLCHVFITIYSKDFWYKRHSNLFRYKKRLTKFKKYTGNTRPFHLKKKRSYSFYIFKSFKLYKSLHFSRRTGISLRKTKSNFLFNRLTYFSYFVKDTLFRKKIPHFFFLKKSYAITSILFKSNITLMLYLVYYFEFNLLKLKCFIVYLSLACKMFLDKFYFFSIKYLNFYLSRSFKFIRCLSKDYKLVLLSSKLLHKKWEGLSLKYLISRYVIKLTGLLNVKITFLYLHSPRSFYKFFNKLKLNVRARGKLRRLVFDMYLVLYHSFKFRSPNFFSLYFIGLIKKNIKQVGQLFSILRYSLPSFCTLFGFKGVRFHLKGRINGAKRSRIMKIQYGSIPLTTLNNNIKYSFNKVMTIHGIYGLKVWYYI